MYKSYYLVNFNNLVNLERKLIGKLLVIIFRLELAFKVL